MAEGEEKDNTPVKNPKEFKLEINPKLDQFGNPIVGFEGPMVPGDSTRKKQIEEQGDEE